VLVDVRACALNRLDLLQRIAPVVRGFALEVGYDHSTDQRAMAAGEFFAKLMIEF